MRFRITEMGLRMQTALNKELLQCYRLIFCFVFAAMKIFFFEFDKRIKEPYYFNSLLTN